MEKYLALKIASIAKTAEQKLLSALAQSEIFRLCYAYKSRTKPEKSLLDKVAIKQKSKQYCLYDITDVVGIRLVTLFRQEMLIVFTNIVDLIMHNGKLNPNPLIANSVEEIICYKTNEHDEIFSQICKIAEEKKLNVAVQDRISKEGYTSIHVVTRIDHNHDIPERVSGNAYYIPLEIQIRTVFEDAWGEIDHKYGYIIRTGKDAGKPIVKPENILRHLKVLKTFTDACSNYADAIYCEASPQTSIDVFATSIMPTSETNNIVDKFKSAGIDEKSIELFQLAETHRKIATKTERGNPNRATREYFLAAEYFRESTIDHSCTCDGTQTKSFFYFSAKMHEAECLLLASGKDATNTVFSIYSDLSKHGYSTPLVTMRLGQMYSKLGQSEESLTQYRRASERIFGGDEKITDFFSVESLHHMRIHLPKLHGYQIWKKADKIITVDQKSSVLKFKLLIKALEITLVSNSFLENESDEVKRGQYNNILYYLSEINSLMFDLLPTNREMNKLATHIQAVISEHYNTDINGAISNLINTTIQTAKSVDDLDIGVLDTLAVGYESIGDVVTADDINDKIIERGLADTPDGETTRLYNTQLLHIALARKNKYIKAKRP